MDIGGAIEVLRDGGYVVRAAWGGKDKFIGLLNPGPNAEMTEPYFYICKVDESKEPWIPNHTELLAKDWEATK